MEWTPHRAGASGAADAGQSDKGIYERQQERCRRRTSDLEGGTATRRADRGSKSAKRRRPFLRCIAGERN